MSGYGERENDPLAYGETVVDLSRHNTASSAANDADHHHQHMSPPVSAAESGHDVRDPEAQSKPQVIVRIRPSPNLGNSVFEVDSETKTIQIRVDRADKDPGGSKQKLAPGFIYFQADNILENSSQEDTFNAVAHDLIEKALSGVPGMIVAVGPEMSGKSFSLFGLNGRYRNRGIVARVMEKLFELKNNESDRSYRFGLGIVEVRREKIRDLLTLDHHEINDVGDRGPKGMYVEEVDCLEHGLGLLLRALIGQKLIHQEPYERFHTIAYLEIIAVSPDTPEISFFESRITFAEITSAPLDIIPNSPTPNCRAPPQPKPEAKFKFKESVFPSIRCCRPTYTAGPLAESISVRRDIFALEQIFDRANEMQRVRKYFAKLENLGLSMIASEKRRLSSGHNFRQSRLAHCLKDILGSGTQIRILLHVRPDKDYLKSSLEAMRFAERAKLVPSNFEGDGSKGKGGRTEEQILQEVITDIAPELDHPNAVEALTVDKMKAIQEQAVHYFDNNIDSMKVCTKEKVKHMFENFRVLWNFLWELELNVTLRKAEEEMMGSVGGKSSKMKNRKGSALTEYDGDHYSSKDHIGGKKSGRKMKKEKLKKGKKGKQVKTEGGENPEEGETSGKKSSLAHSQHEGDKGGGEERSGRGSTDARHSHSHGNDETGSNKSHHSRHSQQHTTPSIDGAPTEAPQTTAQELEATSQPITSDIAESPKTPPPRDGELGEGEGTTPPPPTSTSVEQTQQTEAKSRTSSITPHPHYDQSAANLTQAAHFRHSTFFLRGGFDDFKLQYHDNHQKDMTEEERAAYAAEQEQVISNNFEEMKKVARRQAIHLLRTGVKRPQWLPSF